VTVPTGASVIKNGLRIGKTPHVFKLRPGESRTVLVAKAGYKDQKVTVTAGDEDATERIRLKRGISRKAVGIPPSDPF
jgi:hypothetical protein